MRTNVRAGTIGQSAAHAIGAARIALWAALLTLAVSAAARADSAFTVQGVPVDAEAQSAAEARELAIARGQRTALGILLDRLTLPEEGASRPTLDGGIESLIDGFSIADERVSATRYRARLTVDFDGAAVRRMLRESGIPHVETASKPVLVIAVQRGPEGDRLWGVHHPWRRAWEERGPRGGLVPLLLPLGDILDLGMLDAGRALLPDETAVSVLARRYGTTEAVVTAVRVTGPRDAPPADGGGEEEVARAQGLSLFLSAIRLGGRGTRTFHEVLEGGPGESEPALLRRAVERVVAFLERDWKTANVVDLDASGFLAARVPIRSLGEWVAIRRSLSGLAVISEIEIDSISRGMVALGFRYHGSRGQLDLALAQVDLALAREEERWVLSRQTGGAAMEGGQ